MIRVLLLDDEPIFARWLADQLRWDSDGQIHTVVALTLDDAISAVRVQHPPFDVFLVDERLGPGKDGIRAMEDLYRACPDAESIIFTGADDPAVGLRAYRAGAWDYLPKTVEVPELIWRLRSLHGLRMLNDATNRAQRALSFGEAADVVVQGGLQLGFERARLWRLDEGTQTMTGASVAGEELPERFAEQHIPLAEAVYARQALDSLQEMTLFHGEELGPGYLSRTMPGNGGAYRPPVGDWIAAPLRASTQFTGLLVLDNVYQQREITIEQRRLLRQFCRAASAALERAQLYARVQQLNEIGVHVMNQAAHSDLNKLLKAVRAEIQKFTDAHNFIAALVEEEGSRRFLHYRLRYEDGRLQPASWRSLSEPGLLAHLIKSNAPLFLPDHVDEFRRANGIKAFNKPARSWMGAPLRVKGRAVGAIVVENNRRANAYTESEFNLFKEAVEQIQGAIHIARLEEQQAQNNRRLHLLQHAGEEMMKLAEERGEDALWQTTLTAATANYGLQFNRAMLFLAEDGGAKVRGRAGVGHFDGDQARSDWEHDRDTNLNFDQFLARVRTCQVKHTPVHQQVLDWVVDVPPSWNVFAEALRTGRTQRVLSTTAAKRLPQSFVERFGPHDCAVLPLRAGSQIIGLAVVDNAHDKKPIRQTSLGYLESLLAQAALTYQSVRQRKARERLNDLTWNILSKAGDQSLKVTLTEICDVSRAVAQVDCALIVPIAAGAPGGTYDIEQAGSAGWQKVASPVRQPRSDGVAAHVLRTGMLVIPNIAEHDRTYTGQPLAQHSMLREEGIRAQICALIRVVETDEALGVFHMYYRSPQAFSKSDVTQAEVFASLAAVAIQNWRAAQKIRAETAEAEAEVQNRERELSIHQRVLKEALHPDATQERVIHALLDATRDTLSALPDLPALSVEVDLRVWEPLDQASAEPREIRHEFYRDDDGTLRCQKEFDLWRGVIGRAFQTGQTQLALDVTEPEWKADFYPFANRNTRSELVVPIVHGDERDVIGVINVEAPHVGAFTAAHVQRLERLATIAALALDNARRLESRQSVLEASRAIAAPINLSHTLQTIQEVIRKVAPDLSVLTIWHVDLKTNQLKLGAHFGVHDLDALQMERSEEGGVIQRVLKRKRPLFVMQASGHPFSSDFVRSEGIQSFAAFPLIAEGQDVGVMFLSYRYPHRFTPEERNLFAVLADFVLSSVRDAALLDFAETKHDQLSLAQRVAEAAATTSVQDEALRRIMTKLKDIYPSAAITIYAYDRAEHVLEVTPASLDFYPFEDVGMTGSLNVDGRSIASHVARLALQRGEIVCYNCGDANADEYYLPGTGAMNSELCVSLMSVGGDLLGVLILESPERDAFNEDDEQQMRSIAQQISLVLERSNLFGQLVYHTAFTEATAGFVEFAHGFGDKLLMIRRRTARLLRKEPQLSTQGRCWAQEIDESAVKLWELIREAQMGMYGETERLPFDSQVRSLVEEACLQYANASLTIEWDLKCDGLAVGINRKMFKGVLRHLVGNAARAMNNVGQLFIRTRPRAGPWVEMEIEDSGPGVDEKLRSLLFQQIISERPGHGTGLLLVRYYVESMGGTVRLLESAPGQGAIFAITLRIAPGGALA